MIWAIVFLVLWVIWGATTVGALQTSEPRSLTSLGGLIPWVLVGMLGWFAFGATLGG